MCTAIIYTMDTQPIIHDKNTTRKTSLIQMIHKEAAQSKKKKADAAAQSNNTPPASQTGNKKGSDNTPNWLTNLGVVETA